MAIAAYCEDPSVFGEWPSDILREFRKKFRRYLFFHLYPSECTEVQKRLTIKIQDEKTTVIEKPVRAFFPNHLFCHQEEFIEGGLKAIRAQAFCFMKISLKAAIEDGNEACARIAEKTELRPLDYYNTETAPENYWTDSFADCFRALRDPII